MNRKAYDSLHDLRAAKPVRGAFLPGRHPKTASTANDENTTSAVAEGVGAVGVMDGRIFNRPSKARFAERCKLRADIMSGRRSRTGAVPARSQALAEMSTNRSRGSSICRSAMGPRLSRYPRVEDHYLMPPLEVELVLDEQPENVVSLSNPRAIRSQDAKPVSRVRSTLVYRSDTQGGSAGHPVFGPSRCVKGVQRRPYDAGVLASARTFALSLSS